MAQSRVNKCGAYGCRNKYYGETTEYAVDWRLESPSVESNHIITQIEIF